MARDVALEGRRRGQEPVVILLTDCRTNVARDGSGGRPAAERDARASAETIALAGIDTLLIDTSLRPHTFASELQAALHARYLHLPNAASETLAASAALMTGQPAKRRAGPSSHDQH
jgi:magnesium chelatase subunit D